MATTTLDDVLNLLVESLGKDIGGTLRARGKFTGDDKDGIAEAADVAAPNQISVSALGLASIGGRDTGGAYKFQFSDAIVAQNYVDRVKVVLSDFGSSIKAGTDVVENLLLSAAKSFGGSLRADANVTGDTANDGVDYRGGSSVSLDAANARVSFGGRDVGGNFSYQFDDVETAMAFQAVALKIRDWGAANY